MMPEVVILCGGRGTRLRPLTDSMPKTLVPLNGKPVLQHILEYLLAKGLGSFVLCIGYQGGMIKRFVEEHGFAGRVRFSDQGENASMLRRLCAARDLVGQRFFVTYGDTLIDVDHDDMLAKHLAASAALTLTTAQVVSPFGLIQTDQDGRVVSFVEKPVQTFFVGQYLLESSVLDEAGPELADLPDGQGLVALIQRLAAEGRVRSHPYSGPQITFNTEKELDQAERELIKFYTHAERNQ